MTISIKTSLNFTFHLLLQALLAYNQTLFNEENTTNKHKWKNIFKGKTNVEPNYFQSSLQFAN